MVDEQRLEDIIEKSGHYADFKEWFVRWVEGDKDKRGYSSQVIEKISQRLDKFTEVFNQKLTESLEPFTDDVIKHIGDKFHFVGGKEGLLGRTKFRRYLDDKVKRHVKNLYLELRSSYDIRLNFELESIERPYLSDVTSLLNTKVLRDSPEGEELFTPQLSSEQIQQYIENTELSGVINPQTSEAFILSIGHPGESGISGRRLDFSDFIEFHTHPNMDSTPSGPDLKQPLPHMIVSSVNSIIIDSGKTENKEEIMSNLSKFFPMGMELDKLEIRWILSNFDIQFFPFTINDIKLLSIPEIFQPMTIEEEKSEIIKEYRERQSATQLPGIQVGGIHKPFDDIQNRNWEPPERRNFDIEEHLKRMFKEDDIRVPQFGRPQEILPTRKEELQDGLDVVPSRSDNLEYGSDFGGRRFRMEEKEESRLLFDFTPEEYDSFLAELQTLEPEEALLFLELFKNQPKKLLRPRQTLDARERKQLPREVENEHEMYQRILEELEQE